MTPYRIAVVDDLERDRAWLAEKLAACLTHASRTGNTSLRLRWI